MKILMVNKFLYPHGGSETYILDLGKELVKRGHEVQYFGMEDKAQTVGNRVGSYTSSMDFHGKGIKKVFYPFKIIYSAEARKKIRLVLDDFCPDVVHLNNINFQLTPSIIYEIRKWEKKRAGRVKIVYTAHDSQWVCPNHMLMIPSTKELCFQCKGGHYSRCTKNRCIHNSGVKSLLGSLEAFWYRVLGTYKQVDRVICPSHFMKEILSSNPAIADRLTVLHNYGVSGQPSGAEKKDYVLYFGRYSREKGIEVLLKACEKLPQISFVFAGEGPLREQVEKAGNVKDLGFLKGEGLRKTIAEARLAVVPSIVYENCPFAVIEAQQLGTPVVASNLGGIPELIDLGETGEVFAAGKEEELAKAILDLWSDEAKCSRYSDNCLKKRFDSLETYCDKLLKVYGESGD